MKNILNNELKASDIPSREAGFGELCDFALTFDGYKHWGSFKKCSEVASKVSEEYQNGKNLVFSIDELRTALFFKQRSMRHGDCAMTIYKESGEIIKISNGDQIKTSLIYMRTLVDKIRKIITDNG